MVGCFTTDIYVYKTVCGNFIIYVEGSMMVISYSKIEWLVGYLMILICIIILRDVNLIMLVYVIHLWVLVVVMLMLFLVLIVLSIMSLLNYIKGKVISWLLDNACVCSSSKGYEIVELWFTCGY